MTYPIAQSFSAASGATIYAGRAAPSGLPVWLQAMAVGELASISGTAPSASSGVVPAVAGSMGTQAGITNAWCGGIVHGKKFIVHGGGHADYGGNEFPVIDLSTDAPAWDLLIERTPVGNLLGGSNYYADGRPTSRHTYYGMFVATIASAAKILRFNANMGFAYNGAPVNGAADVRTLGIDGFDLTSNVWEPAAHGTMPRITGSETAMGQDPVTGDVYVWGSNSVISKYDATTGLSSDIADLPGVEGAGAALFVDAANGRLVRIGGRASGGVVYTDKSGGGAKVAPALTGPGAVAFSAALSGEQHGWGRAHDTTRNHAYLYTTAGAIFRLDLANFSVAQVAPTGEALHAEVNGWWGRAQYMDELDIIVSLASWTSAIQIYRVA
jgi:hypothetical protein